MASQPVVPLQNGEHAAAGGQNGYKQTYYEGEGDCLYGEDDLKKNPELSRMRTQGCNDIIGVILFLGCFIALIALGSKNIQDGKLDHSLPTTECPPLVKCRSLILSFVDGTGLGFAFGCAFSFIMLIFWKCFPQGFIYFALGWQILICIAIGAYCAKLEIYASAAVFFVIAFLLFLWTFFCIRHVIPLCALMCKMSINFCFQAWGTFLATFVGLAFFVVWFIFWAATAGPVMIKVNGGDDQNASGGESFGLILAFFFGLCTTLGWIHVVTGGAIATIYFSNTDSVPYNLTLPSMKRATFQSLGSIALGGLLVAFFRTLEYMIRSMRSENGNACLQCILECIVSCLTRLIEYFCDIAFSSMAIYGEGFFASAGHAVEIIKRGMFAQFTSEIIVDKIIYMLVLFVTAISGVLAWVALDYAWPALVGGILGGLVASAVITNVPASGVTTVMVCISDCKELLPLNHPEYARELDDALETLSGGICCGCGGSTV